MLLRIRIEKWKEKNPRKDVKAPSWFRFDHGFFDDPEGFKLTPTQTRVWLGVLCYTNKRVRLLEGEIAELDIETEQIAAMTRIDDAEVILAFVHFHKLKGWLTVLDEDGGPSAEFASFSFVKAPPESDRARTVHVPPTSAARPGGASEISPQNSVQEPPNSESLTAQDIPPSERGRDVDVSLRDGTGHNRTLFNPPNPPNDIAPPDPGMIAETKQQPPTVVDLKLRRAQPPGRITRRTEQAELKSRAVEIKDELISLFQRGFTNEKVAMDGLSVTAQEIAKSKGGLVQFGGFYAKSVRDRSWIKFESLLIDSILWRLRKSPASDALRVAETGQA